MAKKTVPKPSKRLICDLEDQVHLLRVARRGLLSGDVSYAKLLSTSLRNLVCYVSKSEGLLWRVADRYGLDDRVQVRSSGPDVDLQNPLVSGLSVLVIPNTTASTGPDQVPVIDVSLRSFIKGFTSCVVHGKAYTYEEILRLTASQTGLGHELDQVDRTIVALEEFMPGEHNGLLRLLGFSGELVEAVSLRVLQEAAFAEGLELASKPLPSFGRTAAGVRVGDLIRTQPAPQAGTVAACVTGNIHALIRSPRAYRFPPIAAGDFSFSSKKTAAGSFEFELRGLDQRVYSGSVKCSVSEDRTEMVIIARWNSREINVSFGRSGQVTVPRAP